MKMKIGLLFMYLQTKTQHFMNIDQKHSDLWLQPNNVIDWKWSEGN